MAIMRNRSHKLAGLALLLGLGLAAGGASADVYRYRDALGRTILTDKPMKGDVQLVKVYRLRSARPAPVADLERRRRTYTAMISRVAREQRLQPALLHAVVRAESAYDPRAVSAKGAVGLMQLMPATAQRYGVRDRHDPRQNLDGGARYLRDLLAMFDNDLDLALAAYNAGENAVLRNGRQIPPYPETRDYVRKVQHFYRQQQAASLAAR